MRTDTRTFKNRVFRMVRSLGINSRRSKPLAKRIVSLFSHGAYDAHTGTFVEPLTTIGTIDLRLEILSETSHAVSIHADGEFIGSMTNAERTLVDVRPSSRQIELRDRMIDLVDRIREIRNAADRLGENEEIAIAGLLAEHDRHQTESISINPFVDVGIIDPELAMIHYEVCKDDGHRPGPYNPYGRVKSYMDRREAEFAAQAA